MSLTTGTYLERILENTADELAVRRQARPFTETDRAARTVAPALPVTGLRTANIAVIAEIKRSSPSRGTIAPEADVEAVASDYLAGGAAAISVLTDTRFFSGTLDDLQVVATRAHSGRDPRPVLRKDFVIDVYQLAEARAAGADIVLLIVAALDNGALRELYAATLDYGMTALVEVHDEVEIERACALDATLVGINNRDLRAFRVDLSTTERLAPLLPAGVTLVSESGVHTRADVARLGRAGVHAVLVGESLMRANDRVAALRELGA